MRTYLLAAVLGLTACNNSSSDAPKVAASAAPVAAAVAGRVLEVSGTVTAGGKPLAKGDTVAADAIVETGTDGSVVIELAHNLVRWELGPNKKVKVTESVAWKAPKRTEPTAEVEHDTISGGRPAERLAAGTTTTEGGTAEAEADEDKNAKADRAEPKTDAAQRRREAMEAAKQSGVTGILEGGVGDLGLKGTGPGGGGTGGGLGVTGTGKGGGGTGEGTIGIGNVGTIGHGAGSGTGQGYGGKVRGGGGNGKSPTVRQGTVEVSGELAPEIVRRVVRQRMNQLRYCYEKALMIKPDLRGKVVVDFVIGSNGAVTTAKVASSTLGDDTATACMVSVFKKMAFPTPVSGSVNVSYPLTFSPGD